MIYINKCVYQRHDLEIEYSRKLLLSGIESHDKVVSSLINLNTTCELDSLGNGLRIPIGTMLGHETKILKLPKTRTLQKLN